ncbi:MAG: beta-N-acetylhexosaminidase [Saprospiraceae bacterium]
MKTIVLRFITLILMIWANNYVHAQKPGLIPKPNSIEWLQDSVAWRDIGFLPNEAWTEVADLVGMHFPELQIQKEGKIQLVVQKNASLSKEAYQIEFKNGNLILTAASYPGVNHGLQTLKQLTKKYDGLPYLIKANISDEPRFGYRGLHLDTGRHFFAKEFIFEYLDMMARYKLNVFHWHLTEDQGWRIEIKKYPRLQTVAAWRNKTLIGHAGDHPKKYDDIKYGGYYTHEDIQAIVSYAKKLGIEVIPEIEMPGHASAAIAAYPELGCTGNNIEVVGDWGVFDDVFCPTETTFQFLEDVLTEVMSLFPSEYIHIGGDECPKIQWKNNAACQELIRKMGLKDEHELQSYFIRRIEIFVNKHGKKIIGWDEILEGGLAPNATVMSWRGIEGGKAAAKMGHDVIMTPTDYCYLDYLQSKGQDEGLAIGGFLPLEKVYSYDPVPSDLDVDDRKYILGTQGNVWTEYMDSPARVWYQVLPRMTALAEVAWSKSKQKDFNDYLNRLDDHYTYWQAQGINAADKRNELYYEIKPHEGQGIQLNIRAKGKDQKVNLSKNGQHVSGFNGSLWVNESCIINATSAASPEKNKLNFEFTWHKAAGKTITLGKEPDDRYVSFGPVTLIDGLKGRADSHKEGWLGFNQKDLDFEIALDANEAIDTIEISFYHNPSQWIYAPDAGSLSLWAGDQNIHIIKTQETLKGNVESLVLVIQGIKTSALKIKIPNDKAIEQGMPGGGNLPWVFMDEIVVR